MSWLGMLIGACGGACFGGRFGMLIGATLGSYIEERVKTSSEERAEWKQMREEAQERMRARRRRSPEEKELIFLTAAGAMLAKLAKADGHVDETEIASGERAFMRLGLTPEKREYCIRAFRRAKGDEHTIYEYAEEFANVTPARAMRELFYDILWDLACADGVVTDEERRILERIVIALGVRPSLYAEERARRLGGSSRSSGSSRYSRSSSSSGSRRQSASSASSATPDPYETLGTARSATTDELRKAYRAMAKKYHPDLLRAQGLPEELIEKANAQMARINAAWETVKRERGL